MVNEGGQIEGGMLGEYVSLYDTNSDPEHPSTVPESHTNTDPRPPTTATKNDEDQQPQRIQSNQNRIQTNAVPEAEPQNATKPILPVQNWQQQNTVVDSNSAQIIYVPVYLEQPQNQQVIPPLMNGQYQNPSYVQQPNTQYQYVQVQSQPQQQIQYVQQPVQYVQQPVQYQQVSYTSQPNYSQNGYQQPVYIQSAPSVQPQMSSYVGMGSNQVPTLIY